MQLPAPSKPYLIEKGTSRLCCRLDRGRVRVRVRVRLRVILSACPGADYEAPPG